jgi:hypothetical protein
MTEPHMPRAKPRSSGLALGLWTGLLLLLSGCIGWDAEQDAAAKQGPHLGADFGNAVSHNAVRHIIDPNPPGSGAGSPSMDGVRAAKAFDRYRQGAVTPLESVETSTFGEAR